MQRIIVDLPDPDGPQMTMRSPPITRRLMSRSTWKSPYHLFMATMSTATGVESLVGEPEFAAVAMTLISMSVAPGKAGFGRARIARHGVAEGQVKHGGNRIAGRAHHRRCPFRIDARDFDGAQQIENADDEDQGRVLEQADIGVDD